MSPMHRKADDPFRPRRPVFGAVRLAILTAILLLAPRADGAARYPSTRVYGYFDLEAKGTDQEGEGGRWTFDQHHLTVITYVEISSRYRVLFETAYEHGPDHPAGGGTGKIYLPKAYFEYFRSESIRFRAGKFLPPFGIYNERHDATPTILSTALPPSVYGKHLDLSGPFADSLGGKERAYPRFATGAWALGRFYAGDMDVEYNVYVVNGRGTEPDEQDDNANKGVGGRLVIVPSPGIRVGFSYYGDRNGLRNDARQDAFGADLEGTWGGALLEAAVVLPRYEELGDDGRPHGHRRNAAGAYVLAGYCLFDRLTPFVYHDVYDPDRAADGDHERDTAVGANFALDSAAFLKGEVHFLGFDDDRDGYRSYVASIAVAF